MIDDDSEDMGDMWREVKKHRQQKRARNRQSSPQQLTAAGIAYETKNGGSHLVIEPNGHRIDFWPGTGLWIPRGGERRNRGVRSLIKKVTA